MYNDYLIPANSKKQMLILGFFTGIDLAIFGTGIVLTFVMLLLISGVNSSIWNAILILSPALISGFLVLPVPHYHNVMQLITNIIKFFIERRRYYWKGWSIHEEK
ncbi:MAG: hypothetical protein IJ574_01255 [Bacilli bacterium]|nr:hypothetical protein [Bacilli bacterium]